MRDKRNNNYAYKSFHQFYGSDWYYPTDGDHNSIIRCVDAFRVNPEGSSDVIFKFGSDSVIFSNKENIFYNPSVFATGYSDGVAFATYGKYNSSDYYHPIFWSGINQSDQTYNKTSSGLIFEDFFNGSDKPATIINEEGLLDYDKKVNVEMLPNWMISPLFEATVEAVEESIINVLCAAEDLEGINDNKVWALPHDRLIQIMKKYNRIN